MTSGANGTKVPDESSHTSLRHSLLGPSLLKAGQDKVDQKKVGEVIYNASKGSKFFKHEEKRDEQLTKRIEIILRRKKHLASLDLCSQVKRVDEEISALEASRDLSQIIVHVDCDAFYASVEELDRPELKEVPMAVGGGVLTTCNYKAREFGVRSGMAGYIAKQLCPQLVFLPLNFHKYSAKAEEVREVLVKYDEKYEAASVDEAFLNITKYLKEHDDVTPDQVVKQIRNEVLENTKISVSAGIAPNARHCAARKSCVKPEQTKRTRIPNDREEVMYFMRTLPVRKVNGVGRVFERELDAVGVKTWGDVHAHRGVLSKLFSEKAWLFLLNCYLGLGRTHIHPVSEYERKSLGTERTFRDLSGSDNLREKLRETAQELEKDLLRAGLAGRTVNVKVKLHTYEVHTRQRALHRAIHRADDLYVHSLPLLQELEVEFAPLKVRLMGLRVTQLSGTKRDAGKLRDFFKNVPAKRRREEKDEEEGIWEVWPEEEFEEMVDREGDGNGLLPTEHLSQEVKEEEESAIEEAIKASLNTEGLSLTNAMQRWECPICARSLPADDAVFNEHVDFCLSRETIREVVQESSGHLSESDVKQPDRKKRDTTPRTSSRPGSKSGGMDHYFLKLQ